MQTPNLPKSEIIKKFSDKLFDDLNNSLNGRAAYDYCNAEHSIPEEWRDRMNLLIANLVLDLESHDEPDCGPTMDFQRSLNFPRGATGDGG